MIRVVLLDLDGVIRHFDPSYTADIENRYNLQRGKLASCAFAHPLIDQVTTGQITRSDWIRRIGQQVGVAQAAEEWGAQPARVEDSVLMLMREVRDAGLRTAVLTNGTDSISAELSALGIACQFDAIFNSATIGHAKPDRRAFEHVLDALSVKGSEVLFVDDSASNLLGAERLSIHTHLYTDVATLRAALIAGGVALTA
ncbi:HAD family phosphatase [Microbacterium sp. NPDC076768]|uniref:HAD family hydrolase n=1 Tax=Microbacterium sp. NPDC076768 TaxID=3154858 RepID=UPI003418993E